MISISELAWALTGGAPPGKRYFLVLWFYCDASYDSDPKQDSYFVDGKYIPRTFVVGGILATEDIWKRIQDPWRECNKWAGVSRYHGAAINARDGEFAGWDKPKQIEYSRRLLNILNEQGTQLCAISMGLKVRDYLEIISDEGRAKWGTPSGACFKQCIGYIVQLMCDLPPDYRLSVLVDRGNDLEGDADEQFKLMQDKWKPAKRLVTCTPGNAEELLPLQAADLIAYETFKLLDGNRDPKLVRPAFKALIPKNKVLGKWWNAEGLLRMKQLLETAPVGKNGFLALWEDEDIKDEKFQILV